MAKWLYVVTQSKESAPVHSANTTICPCLLNFSTRCSDAGRHSRKYKTREDGSFPQERRLPMPIGGIMFYTCLQKCLEDLRHVHYDIYDHLCSSSSTLTFSVLSFQKCGFYLTLVFSLHWVNWEVEPSWFERTTTTLEGQQKKYFCDRPSYLYGSPSLRYACNVLAWVRYTKAEHKNVSFLAAI